MTWRASGSVCSLPAPGRRRSTWPAAKLAVKPGGNPLIETAKWQQASPPLTAVTTLPPLDGATAFGSRVDGRAGEAQGEDRGLHRGRAGALPHAATSFSASTEPRPCGLVETSRSGDEAGRLQETVLLPVKWCRERPKHRCRPSVAPSPG